MVAVLGRRAGRATLIAGAAILPEILLLHRMTEDIDRQRHDPHDQ